jgi:hypothetical protein
MINIPPVNIPLDKNPGAPVVPKSMADEIKPDLEGLPPAGHARDEVMRERARKLEEQIAQMPQDAAGGVDVSEIPIEREIARAFDGLGNLSVSNQQPGWVYKWKKADDQQTTLAQNLGFILVQGEDPEGREHKGKHCAGGTTLRGAGDVLLWKIPEQRWHAIEDYFRRKGIGMGQVAERMEEYGEELASQGLIPRNLVHAKPGDPLIQRVFANGPDQARTMGRMMREGSLPGATADQYFRR